jgi:hypothetical protein
MTDSNDAQQITEQLDELRRTKAHPYFLVTGQAGTGKTYLIKQAIQINPRFAKLAASTGIAGINLGTTTINQVLKYFNTASLQDNYQSGLLQKQLREVRERHRFLVLDEGSMTPYQQLDLIVDGLDEINADVELENRLGLIIVGDFAQLPPVPGPLILPGGKPKLDSQGREVKEPTPWMFKSEYWQSRFDAEGHTVKLEKIYRQSDPTFLNGINAIRRGVGSVGVTYLQQAGVEFARDLDNHFEGTTIVAKNEEVDRVNKIRLRQLPGEVTHIPSTRWWAGQVRGYDQPGEWKYIPERLELKPGAYVMLLANKVEPLTRQIIYANGDCGWVREVKQIKQPIYGVADPDAEDSSALPPVIGEEIAWVIMVELARQPGELVAVSLLNRMIESRHEPDDDLMQHKQFPKDDAGNPCKVRNAMGRMVWCLGSIEYAPLRLAYASTVHKVQGLSLDRIQIDPRPFFYGNPGMCYVALSRGRTPEGIRVVGQPKLLAERVKCDPSIARFV